MNFPLLAVFFCHMIFKYVTDFANKGGHTPHRYVPVGENNPAPDA